MIKIAFLRGINVSGKNKIPMEVLRELCAELGWASLRTYLQTGNIIFSAEGSNVKLEQDLGLAIESHFGFSIPVIIRDQDEFAIQVSQSPLLEQAAKSPSQVLLYLTKNAINGNALEYLRERAIAGEEMFVQDASIWIYFPKGVGLSKLTPAVIDRAVGSTATGRNWNTVKKIQSMCSQ